MADGIEVHGLEHLNETLRNMTRQLRSLPKKADEELFNWQAEVVNREHPHVRHRSRTTFYTLFRPHSRAEMRGMRKRQRKIERALIYRAAHPGTKRVIPKTYRRWSTRPVLRGELLEALQHRIADLVNRIKW